MAGPWDEFRAAPDSSGPWDAYRGGNAAPDAQEGAGGKKPKSATYRQGEGAASALQGFFNALNGPTLGFGDEVAGVGGAIAGKVADILGRGNGKSMADNYREVRDYVRGAQDKFSADSPILAGATKLAAAAPVFMLGGAAPEAMGAAVATRSAAPGALSAIGQAAKVGGITGTIQGAGDSTADSLGGIAKDALAEGAKSAVMGGGTQAALGVAGGVTNAVGRVLSKGKAQDFAKEKVAEALARSSQGDRFAIENAQDAMRAMGPEARLADVGGEAGRGLLDTMATLPGAAKDMVEGAIRSRQAGRGSRILSDADTALGNAGRDYSGELEKLAAAKLTESKPLYDQIKNVPVELTDDVKMLLARVPTSAWRKVRDLAKGESGVDLKIGDLMGAKELPMGTLDLLKRGLRDVAESEKRAGSADTGRVWDSVRRDLIDKLDQISPRLEGGGSVYKAARETYGGLAQMQDAMELGRRSFGEDALRLKDAISGMGPDQLDAFRMGAMQALRQKAGTQGGQTQLLDFWKNPATQERLRMLFGEDAGNFFQALEREGKFKALESVGRGSQTMRRKFAAEDLDVSPVSVAGAAASAISGNPIGLGSMAANWLGRKWNQVKTPEATRDEIARLLLSQGDEGVLALNSLRNYLTKVSDARLKRAGAAGAFAGVASGL